ncbi:MAG TPA: hypothetical protein VNM91_01090, partial [Dehalococcoidia bacterium]|nr:hypothetical protein [Dehalococcoidia bacterium]
RESWAQRYRGPAPETPQQAAVIGFIGDIIERPQYYDLTPQQRAFLRDNQRFLLARLRYAKAQGVDINEFQGEFVTHLYKEPPSPRRAVPRSGVGARQPTQRTRVFGSYWDAARRGFEPEFVPDAGASQLGAFEALTRVHQAQLQKALADQELIRALRESFPARTTPGRGYRQTSVAGLSGRYFPEDVANQIDDILGPHRQNFLERAVALPAEVAKTLMASVDASPLLGIQGVRRFMDNPTRGLQDIAKAAHLVADDTAWREWMMRNEGLLRDATADGANLFKTFKVSTEGPGASLLARIPGVGRVISAIDDRFYARGVAMYKALSYAEAKAQIEAGQRLPGTLGRWARARLAAGDTPGQVAAQHVNNLYGGLETALRGQSRGYQLAERVALFAPDFLRSQVGLLSQAAKPLTPQGALALRFLAGAMVTNALAAELISWATMRKPANLTRPDAGDWLAAKTPYGNISLLGPLRTYMRTAYQMALDGKARDWERVLSDAEFFGRTRLGPVPSIAWSELQNRDVLDRPVTTARPNSLADIGQRVAFAAKSVLPFSVQQSIEALAKGGAQAPGIAAISLLGFNVYPERVRTGLNAAAQERFGRDYRDLSPGEKQQLADDPRVVRAMQEFDAETKAKADAGDPVAVVQQAEKAVSERYAQTLEQIEGLPPSEWRQRYADARADRLAALDALRRTDARPVREFFERLDKRDPGSPRLQVLHDYFAIFDRYKDPVTGRIDEERKDEFSDALDAFEAKLSPEQAAQLQEDLGARDTPRQAEYRRDSQQIAASGYWDIPNRVFVSLQRSGAVPSEYANYDQFYRGVLSRVRDKLTARGLNPDLAPVIVGQAPAVRVYETTVSAVREALRQRRPELTRLLIKWGYKSPAAKDVPALIRTPAAAAVP